MMNNKGFAVTGILYTLLVLFLVLMISLLTVFSNRKNILNKLKDSIATDETSLKCRVGQIWNFEYTGSEQTFTVPCSGTYKIELWGASGGSYSDTYHGGYGGYTIGSYDLKTVDTIYINVGGTPNNSTTINESTQGGYNGGGDGKARSDCVNNAGGGATSVALSTGTLKSLGENNKQIDVIIVAGGGGGNSYYNISRNTIGGNGGGYIGTNGSYNNAYNCDGYGYGGNQDSGGSYYIVSAHAFKSTVNIPQAGFGYGSAGDAAVGGSGGGGGWYGGRGTSCIGGGGGGSGYIGNSLLTNKHMTCYNCETSDDESTKTISTTNVSEAPISDYAKQGNGYAKITLVGIN